MAEPTQKPFRLAPHEIQVMAPGHGSCIASDMITCEGRQVGFMYREVPDDDLDSGWRFMAGEESDEYMDDPDHHAIYDANTIANYDPDIIPFLNAPAGSAFEREDGTGGFVQVHDFKLPSD